MAKVYLNKFNIIHVPFICDLSWSVERGGLELARYRHLFEGLQNITSNSDFILLVSCNFRY
jgi:hypothetical protein